MADGVKIQLDKRFTSRMIGTLRKYDFEVGILQDKPHRGVRRIGGIGSLAGGPARKPGSKPTRTRISEVSEMARKRTKVNFYTKPIRTKGNRDIMRLVHRFYEFAFGRTTERRLINLMQAVVRNPIARGDYGHNRPATARRKGFSRLLIDTGQLFRNIKARVVRRRS